MKQISIAKLILLSLVLTSGLVFAFPSSSTHAATFTVAAGNDENTDNSSCSLTEAIQNINDQAQTNPDCPAGDGSDDTITLPAGAITLTANLPAITESITIEGQGMDDSVVDGDGQFNLGQVSADLNIRDLTITAYVNEAIFSEQGNLTLTRVEIDGTDSTITGGSFFGFQIQRLDGETSTLTMRDVYIHSFLGNANVGAMGGFLAGVAQNSTINLDLNRVTISDLTNTSNTGTNTSGIVGVTGAIDGTFTPGNINLAADNLTVNDLTSTSGAAGAIAGFAAVNGGNANVLMDIKNSTFSRFRGITNGTFGNTPTTVIGLIGASFLEEDSATTTVDLTNVILTDARNTQTDASSSCDSRDISSGLGGAGVATLTITSQGGNLSSDNTCSDYFTEPSDQNNVSNLASTLDPLADNGGFVPTMALQQDSPAVDAGVTVAGLTTDARLAARPQGNAYDSGAYESPFTAPVDQDTEDEDENNTDPETLAETGDVEWVYILLGIGLVVGSVPAVKLANYRSLQ